MQRRVNRLANSFRRLTVVLVVTTIGLGPRVVFTPPAFAQLPQVQRKANLLERVLLEVSRRTGIEADRLMIVNQSFLGNTGITQFKVRTPDGNIYGIALDANGNPLSQEALEQVNRAVENELSGSIEKLERSLADLIVRGANNPIKVAIWLTGEGIPSRRLLRLLTQANLDALRPRFAAIQQPLVEQLMAQEQQVIYQVPDSPVVIAVVTPLVIQKIAQRPDVERIYLERLVGTPRQNVIVPATPRPTPVLSVSPPEESRQTGVRSVGVELAPKEGEGVAGGSLQLLIDGVDVTSLAEIANTRDGCLVSPDCSPPSGGGIYYTPNGLEPGLHQALTRFQTKEGETKSYTWSFSIETP